jgi:leucyl aminopeptidase
VSVSTCDIGFEGLDGLAGVDALCLFVGEDDRPLPGTAGYVDWRLCGALSRVLRGGFFTGARGDCLLLPSDGRFPIPRIFAVGLGRRQDLDSDALRETLAHAAQVLAKARVESVALEVPGASGLDEAARASALAASFLPTFKGRRVAVLADKDLARRISSHKS